MNLRGFKINCSCPGFSLNSSLIHGGAMDPFLLFPDNSTSNILLTISPQHTSKPSPPHLCNWCDLLSSGPVHPGLSHCLWTTRHTGSHYCLVNLPFNSPVIFLSQITSDTRLHPCHSAFTLFFAFFVHCPLLWMVDPSFLKNPTFTPWLMVNVSGNPRFGVNTN